MEIDRMRVPALLGFGLVLVLAGCQRAAPAPEPAATTSPAMACKATTHWPEWSEGMFPDLTAEERALLEREWSGGPNFACSARLFTRGCGTGCVTGLIHDARTQRTMRLPFAIHRALGQGDPLLSWTLDSPILVATGWRNEIARGVFRYRWDGRVLRKLDQ